MHVRERETVRSCDVMLTIRTALVADCDKLDVVMTPLGEERKVERALVLRGV